MDFKSRVEGRRRTFRLRSLLVAVALIGTGLGWATTLSRGDRRNQEAVTRTSAWINKLQADHPTLKGGTASMDIRGDWFGHDSAYRARYETPTGRPIAVSAEMCFRPSRDAGHAVISAGGRSVTRPIEDIERGRKIDLRAEFPEAFR